MEIDITKIKELLKEHPDQIEAILKTVDLAGATEKIKQANIDLVKFRTETEPELKKLKDLETQLADAQKTSTGSVADKAEVNALKEQVNALTEKYTASEKKAADAEVKSTHEALKASVVSSATTHGAIKPEQLFKLMLADNVVGIEDGVQFFRKYDEKGEPVKLNNIDEAVKSYTDSNKHLIRASETQGSGRSNTNNGPLNTNGPVTKDQARKDFLKG